jgi:hypothetical protein
MIKKAQIRPSKLFREMKKVSYPFLHNQEKWYFEFESIGSKGVITKIVLFTKIKNRLWNLGFGDKLEDDWDDEVISNNGDLIKVIATVAAIANDFSEKWPARVIFIDPVDEKRKSLYNAVFKRNQTEIEQTFQILGFYRKHWRPFDAQKMFDKFQISRKSTNFV